MVGPVPEEARRTEVRLGGELVDVIRLGQGAPLVLVPGLARSWKFTFPWHIAFPRRFEVIAYGLREAIGSPASVANSRSTVSGTSGVMRGPPCYLDRAARP